MSRASKNDSEAQSGASQSVSTIVPTVAVENTSHSLQITSQKLNGKNFLPWSRSAALVIRGKGKFSFIDGSSPRPAVDDPLYASWDTTNSLVMAWLIHSMEDEIGETYMFSSTAKEIWDAVTLAYSDLENSSQLFELRNRARNLRQGDLDETQYYSSLRKLWQEVDMFHSVSWKDPANALLFKKLVQKDRIYDFLAGLNNELDDVRGRLLVMRPLPALDEIFAEVRCEDHRRRVMLGATGAVQFDASALTVNRSSSNHSPNTPQTVQGVTSQSAQSGVVNLTNAQVEQLCNLLFQSSVGSKAAPGASSLAPATSISLMARHGVSEPSIARMLNSGEQWIVDSGATDHMTGPTPSELYGKYTWKIMKFSQINNRELRSNAFEIGGHRWYILIYPQGCDVDNHLSLFLWVANHDKLLPGWSHLAQFTLAVVNTDPKKSKYSDTLHRFSKKEHDWGWKKHMELSELLNGYMDDDTIIIKAQVQVIREKADRPFHCLDCDYRRELLRAYMTNVEQIFRRFAEERRGKLGELIEDKARWSSFCAFWSEVDQSAKCRMSREKTNAILEVVIKHFFIEKEFTSTLVMDSLYSGLKALEGPSRGKESRLKLQEAEETRAPIVCVEKDAFVLVEDIFLLFERVVTEPLPPKNEKGTQCCIKDVYYSNDFDKDSIERDERRLTELGRRILEIFVLSYIFSNKFEVAYQEDVALKMQEKLILEEERSKGK